MTTPASLPVFSLVTEKETPVSHEDFRGKTTILFFYPKDMTPGCTTEACALRDDYQWFQKRGIQIFGISPDDADSHQKFIDKHDLPFSLIADTEHQLAEAFGVWVEKSMYGKTYMGIERSTFIIGPDLKVLQTYRKVKPDQHSAELQEFFNR